jgi:hypothetical protein
MSRSWEGHPPAMDKDNAKRILLEVKSVLDKNDIEFWLCFATCLGAVREDDVKPPVLGQEYIESKGGKVVIVPYSKGISSRDIKNRIIDKWSFDRRDNGK